MFPPCPLNIYIYKYWTGKEGNTLFYYVSMYFALNGRSLDQYVYRYVTVGYIFTLVMLNYSFTLLSVTSIAKLPS